MTDVAIAWSGLPFYASCLIRHLLDREGLDLTVIGTRSNSPYRGLEEILGRRVVWVGRDDRPTWRSLSLPVPKMFFHTGWAYPAFNALADEVLNRGGKVVIMVDNRYRGDLRQLAGAAWFRVGLRRRFSAMWVPGISGRKFARFLGMPESAVVDGLYSADHSVFSPPTEPHERHNHFIFVGQLIPRKGLPEILLALDAVTRVNPDIRLRVLGNGPLSHMVVNHPHIDYFPFKHATEVARHLQASRFLVLPSLEEHWGLVVHEALLVGCGAILSDHVGAAPDLLSSGENGFLVKSGSVDELTKAMLQTLRISSAGFKSISRVSRCYALCFSPARWANSFLKCMEIAWTH